MPALGHDGGIQGICELAVIGTNLDKKRRSPAIAPDEGVGPLQQITESCEGATCQRLSEMGSPEARQSLRSINARGPSRTTTARSSLTQSPETRRNR